MEIGPAPTAAVVGRVGNIVDAAIAESQNAVCAAGKAPVVRGDYGALRCWIWNRILRRPLNSRARAVATAEGTDAITSNLSRSTPGTCLLRFW